jgi:cysteine desulfurase
MDSIYLDHNATTPTRPEVVEAMARCYGTIHANPSSQHRPGQQARRALDDARQQIAEILGADLAPPRRDQLIFTSGGTEANNLAILGIARANDQPPGQIIISGGEHQSVIEPAEHLLEQGWRLDTLGMTTDGVVRIEQLPPLLTHLPPNSCLTPDKPLAVSHASPATPNVQESAPTPHTRLVSVSLGNHETGVLQPVAELAEICNRAGVPMHTDAVQVAGKLPLSFRTLGVAAMSITAHKFQGPLGIGALVIRDGVTLRPLMFGGHQQSGLRPGTESAALAVGMATALMLWQKEQDQFAQRLQALRDRFESELRAATCGAGVSPAQAAGTAAPQSVVIHGSKAVRLPQTSNVAFPGLDGQVLLMALDLAGVACSVGSACSSGSTELSPTLRAMGLPNELVACSLRFSFGATTTEAQIDEAVRRILHVCRELLPR